MNAFLVDLQNKPGALATLAEALGAKGINITGITGAAFYRSSYATGKDEIVPQPIAFSHAHHVGQLGIDCRYCHTSVENSRFAGIPPTKTCMNCHAQIWTKAPMLEPVRESFRTDKSLVWTRVNDLPDFVYFDHSIHINKGVGCNTCHGPVDRMPLMYNYASLQMGVVPELPSCSRKESSAT